MTKVAWAALARLRTLRRPFRDASLRAFQVYETHPVESISCGARGLSIPGAEFMTDFPVTVNNANDRERISSRCWHAEEVMGVPIFIYKNRKGRTATTHEVVSLAAGASNHGENFRLFGYKLRV
jgi:hypothetical protein